MVIYDKNYDKEFRLQNQYWMVLGSGRPNYRHATEQSARDEAERLALSNPDCEFVVLASVCTIKTNLQVATVEHGPKPAWLEQPKPAITIHTTDEDDISNYLNRPADYGMPF